MKFRDCDPVRYQECRQKIRSILGVAGISGLLEVIADIAQEFGDGATFESPDPFWINAVAQVEQCKDVIEKSSDD